MRRYGSRETVGRKNPKKEGFKPLIFAGIYDTP